MILSASRDKTIIVWQLTRDDQNYGYPKRALKVLSPTSFHSLTRSLFCRATTTLCKTSSSPQTDNTPSPRLGTKLSVSGISTLVKQPVVSSATQTTFSPCHSAPITDKSSVEVETRQLNSGTHLGIVNSPSPRRDMVNGLVVCVSRPTPPTPSSSLLDGTDLSR